MEPPTSSKHLRIIDIARREALQCHQHRQRVGAVVTRGGAILSKAFNNGKHAEVKALLQLWPSERKDTTVYVTRAPRKWGREWGLARPCPECWKFLQENGVKTVVYTTNEETVVTERV